MTTFTLHTVETAPEGSKAQLAAATKAWGFTPTLHATLAESPAALIGYDTLFGLVAQSTLTPQEQQVAFLTMTVFSGCAYCTMGHTYWPVPPSCPRPTCRPCVEGHFLPTRVWRR